MNIDVIQYNLKDNATNRYLINELIKYFNQDIVSILELISKTPIPDISLNNLEKIISKIKKYKINHDELKIIIKTISYSPFLSSVLKKNPDYFFNYIFKKTDLSQVLTFDDYIKNLKNFCQNIQSIEELKKYLRYFKQREFLRIGIQDINRILKIQDIMFQLSVLAAAFLEFTADFLFKNHFKISKKDFFILGMGKLGAKELNFSSDIDLIYLFKNNEDKEFFSKFFSILTKLINDVTEDGFVFRIDLRLRPEGINGPIAISYENALFYYENFGRFWERSAFLKAEPIAGNKKEGFLFLKELEPFIYRRSLDFKILNHIKTMKEQINSSLNNIEKLDNIKLGKGGIREIEFIIQTIQLIFGGKIPQLREKNSVKFLKIINNYVDILKKDEVKILLNSYLFLRDLEHKIQILHEKQTHNLPKNKDELLIIARFFNFNSIEEFIKKLRDIQNKVHNIYQNFFYFPIGKSQFLDIIKSLESDNLKQFKESIKSFNINISIERLFNLFKYIKFPINIRRPYSEDISNLIDRLIIIILHILANMNNKLDIEQTLIKFTKLFDKIRYNNGYLKFLIENQEALKFLFTILNESEYLGNLIANYIEIFDEIFFTDFLSESPDIYGLSKNLNKELEKVHLYEDKLEKIRVFKHKEVLQIGVNFLNKKYDIIETTHKLSELAEVILNKTTEIVIQTIQKKLGLPSAKFSIIALGKFGGEELNFASDLDIIFVFEQKDNISVAEYFSKLFQRIISFLTIRTVNGIAYEIDTRLRPSGNAGALVTSFESFKDYHFKKSAVWEIQALLKARHVVGDKNFGQELIDFIHTLIKSYNFSQNELKEILRIRKRIENEEAQETKNKIDIKSGAGGIIDIEFLTQILMIQWKIIEKNTFNALKILYKNKIIPKKEFDILYNGYIFLRNLENMLRLQKNKHTDKIENPSTKIIKIKKDIRKIFLKFFPEY